MSDVSDSDPGSGPPGRGHARPGRAGHARASPVGRCASATWRASGSASRGLRPRPTASPIDYYVVKEIRSGRPSGSAPTRAREGARRTARGTPSRWPRNRSGSPACSDRSLTAVATRSPVGCPTSAGEPRRRHHEDRLGKPARAVRRSRATRSPAGPAGAGRPAPPTLDLTNLDNNRTYTFKIYSRNKAGRRQQRESEPFQSLGTPLTPASLRVTDQQSGRDVTNVSRLGGHSCPRGRPDDVHGLLQRNDGAPTAVPGCVRVEAPSCLHRRALRRRVLRLHHHRVQRAEHLARERTRALRSDRQARQPGGRGPGRRPTGGQPGAGERTGARLTGRSRHARPSSSMASRRRRATGPSGAQQEFIVHPSNESDYAVSLRVCNENAARVGCRTATPKRCRPTDRWRRHTSTGQLPGRRTHVSWTISGTANGDAAVVGISIDGGAEQFVPQGGRRSFSFTQHRARFDYNTPTNIHVRLFDDNPGGRGEAIDYEQTRSGSAATGDVTISKRRLPATTVTPAAPGRPASAHRSCRALHGVQLRASSASRCTAPVQSYALRGRRRRSAGSHLPASTVATIVAVRLHGHSPGLRRDRVGMSCESGSGGKRQVVPTRPPASRPHRRPDSDTKEHHDDLARAGRLVQGDLRPADRQHGEGRPRQAPRRTPRADLPALRGPHPPRGLPRHRQDDAGAGAGQHGPGHPTRASSSRPTCCPPTSPASRSTTSTRAPSSSTPARSSTRSCSPTRSTAPRPRPSRRCSR